MVEHSLGQQESIYKGGCSIQELLGNLHHAQLISIFLSLPKSWLDGIIKTFKLGIRNWWVPGIRQTHEWRWRKMVFTLSEQLTQLGSCATYQLASPRQEQEGIQSSKSQNLVKGLTKSFVWIFKVTWKDQGDIPPRMAYLLAKVRVCKKLL